RRRGLPARGYRPDDRHGDGHLQGAVAPRAPFAAGATGMNAPRNDDALFEERDFQINEYVDGLLSGEALASFERQLEADADRRAEVAAIQQLLNDTAALPAGIKPPGELWGGIESRLTPRAVVRFPR